MDPSLRPGQAIPAGDEGIIVVTASRFVLVAKQSLILDKLNRVSTDKDALQCIPTKNGFPFSRELQNGGFLFPAYERRSFVGTKDNETSDTEQIFIL